VKSVTKTDLEGRNYEAYPDSESRRIGRELAVVIAQEKGIKPESVPIFHLPPSTPIKVVEYKTGSKILWPIKAPLEKSEGCKKRASFEQSLKSRLNASWTFLNAESDFELMITLTYPSEMWPDLNYDRVKSDRTKFLKRLRRMSPLEYGWILEFGSGPENDHPHFHVFVTKGWIEKPKWRRIKRKGKEVELLSGERATDIAQAWIDSAGIYCNKGQAFNFGGITERLREPDSAARYVAKEAAKRVQKQAPWPVKQWWQISRSIKPQVKKEYQIELVEFLLKYKDNGAMLSKIWESF